MEYHMEKILLRNAKKFRLFVVQYLIIGLFASSLLPQACFCGEACLHGLQGKAMASLNFMFHNRCSGARCKSCNFEDGQTLKASNASDSTAKLKTIDSPFILIGFSDCQSSINFEKIFFSCLNKYIEAQSPPKYLRNLSLLL